MPRGPSGIYTLPPSYLAVDGETIRTDQHNPPLEDIAQALTNSLPRSGVAPMTGNLQMGGNKVTNMADATADGDAVRLAQIPVAALPLQPNQIWTFHSGGYQRMTISPFMRSVTVAADAAAAREAIGSGRAGLEFIETRDASNDSSLPFTGFDPTRYDSYVFEIANLRPAADGNTLRMATSGNGGASYDFGASNYSHSRVVVGHVSTPAVIGQGNPADSVLLLHPGLLGNGADETISGTVRVHGPHLATHTHVTFQLLATANDGSGGTLIGSGRRISSTPVNAVTFFFGTGNTTSGTITMYGLRNS